MKKYGLAAVAALMPMGCGDGATDGPEQAAYLTLMGDDTLAVEWIEFDEGTVRRHRRSFGEPERLSGNTHCPCLRPENSPGIPGRPTPAVTTRAN